MVKAYARTIDCVEDVESLEEMKELLRTAWPEMLNALRDAGVLKGKMFLMGSRLFAYFECVDDFDPESGFDDWVRTDERCLEWSQLMQRYQRPVPEADRDAGEWWKNMEEVFCFEVSL